MNKLFLLLLAASTFGCAKSIQSNKFNIDENYYEATNYVYENESMMRIEKQNPKWQGSLLGGQEKVENRKLHLKQLAQTEIAKICPNYKSTDISFTMNNKEMNPGAVGLVGALIVEGANYLSSTYDSIPREVLLTYKCI